MTRELDLERLLREARGVPRLARRLCADASLADDLAQDAWVAAIESPPRDASAGRAWFARVLQNLARQRGRSEAARRDRERAVARREAHVEDVVARAETSRRLVGAVLALDEPYRSTLLASFFDGLSPAEIAERTGTNASTVRTRLERGLAQLRERLEREGGRAWLSALAPLATGSSADAAVKTAVITGFAMTTAAKIGIALAGALALVWFAWDRVDGATPDASTAAEPLRVARTDPEPSRAAVEPAAPRESVRAPEIATTPAASAPAIAPKLDVGALETATDPGYLEGIVLRGEQPIDGGTLWYRRGHWRPVPFDPVSALGALEDGGVVRAEIGRDGRFRVGPLPTNWYTLAVDAGAGVGVQTFVMVDAEKPGQRVVIVLGTGRIEGRVWDANGAPVEGAAIRVSAALRTGQSRELHAQTDASGRYAVTELDALPYWISLDEQGRIGRDAGIGDMRQLPKMRTGETRVVDFGSPDPGVRWRGRLVLRDGSAPPFGWRLGWKSMATDAYSEIESDGPGPFELTLRAGEYELQAKLTTSTLGFGTDYLALGTHVVGPVDFERDLVVPGAVVSGRVLGVRVEELPRATLLSLRTASDPNGPDAEVAADGRFRFVGVEPGRYRVLTGPKLAIEPATWVEVREGDVSVPIDVPLVPR